MKRIAVISDTHIPYRAKHLPEKVWEQLEDIDLIIHCGDVNDKNVLLDLEQIAPVKAVIGNTDPLDIVLSYPQQEVINFGGIKIGVFHGNGRDTALENTKNRFVNIKCQVICFGHSHTPYNQWEDGVLYFNPGSPVAPRNYPEPTMGILEIGDEIIGKIISL